MYHNCIASTQLVSHSSNEMMVACPPAVALAKLIQEVSDLSWFAHAFLVFIHLLSLYSGLQPCIPHRNLNTHGTPPQSTLHPTSTHPTQRPTPHINPLYTQTQPSLHPTLSSMLPFQRHLRVHSQRKHQNPKAVEQTCTERALLDSKECQLLKDCQLNLC